MMPKSVKRFSDDIMLYFFDPESDDFRPNRPEIIRLRRNLRRNLYDNRPLVNMLRTFPAWIESAPSAERLNLGRKGSQSAPRFHSGGAKRLAIRAFNRSRTSR